MKNKYKMILNIFIIFIAIFLLVGVNETFAVQKNDVLEVKDEYKNNIYVYEDEIYIRLDGHNNGENKQTYLSDFINCFNNITITSIKMNGTELSDIDNFVNSENPIEGITEIVVDVTNWEELNLESNLKEYDIYFMGDVIKDSSNSININDVLTLRKAIIGLYDENNYPETFSFEATDVDNLTQTRKIGDVADVLRIRKRILDNKWGEINNVKESPIIKKSENANVDLKEGKLCVTIDVYDNNFSEESEINSSSLVLLKNGEEVSSNKININITEISQLDNNEGIKYNLEITDNTQNQEIINVGINQLKLRFSKGAIYNSYNKPNATTDLFLYNQLKLSDTETQSSDAFLGNLDIDREHINKICFEKNIKNANENSWDVSAQGDNSIIAWYEKIVVDNQNLYNIYLSSCDGFNIDSNINSSFLFANIGKNQKCNDENCIYNLDRLNTNNVINMNSMFYSYGSSALNEFILPDSFITNNVTNMDFMFWQCGSENMTKLELSKNFSTSNVSSMNSMFEECGNIEMETLDLGEKFTKIAESNVDMFRSCGKNGCKIYTSEAIFGGNLVLENANLLKLNPNSEDTVSTGSKAMAMCKYYSEISVISQTVSVDPDEEDATVEMTIRAEGNNIQLWNSDNEVINTLDVSDINVYVYKNDEYILAKNNDNNDVSIQLSEPEIKDNGIEYKLTISDFADSTNGYIAIKINRHSIVDIYESGDLYGSGNLNTDYMHNGENIIEFEKPEISYNYSSETGNLNPIINKENKSIEVKFDITDENLDLDSVLDAQKIIVKINDDDVYNKSSHTNMLLDCNELSLTYEDIEDGVRRYKLLISGLDIGDGTNYKGYLQLIFPEKFVIDKIGNYSDEKIVSVDTSNGEFKDDNSDNIDDDGIYLDFVGPQVYKNSDSNVDIDGRKASMTIDIIDENGFLEEPVLVLSDIKILVNRIVVDNEFDISISSPIDITNGKRFNIEINDISSNNDYINNSLNQLTVRVLANKFYNINNNGNIENDLNFYNQIIIGTYENNCYSGFLGNNCIKREYINSISFEKGIDDINDTSWDVSAQKDKSIMAWYDKCYGSDGITELYNIKIGAVDGFKIDANMNSSNLFSYIGYNSQTNDSNCIYGIENLKVSNVTNMYRMFAFCGYNAMNKLNLGDNFDTSRVTKMDNMFLYCGYKNMQNLNIGSKFDTLNVLNMNGMFYFCGYKKLYNLDLEDNFDTSNVTNMSGMFYNCGTEKMVSLELGDNFNTENVTDMNGMFSYCGELKLSKLDLGNKFDTSKVTNMSDMFSYCGISEMTSLDLGDKFDTSNVTNMKNMFFQCGYYKLTNLDLGDKFNTDKVENMSGMFTLCGYKNMTLLNLGKEFKNISSINNNMFFNCGKLNMITIYVHNDIYKDKNHLILGLNSEQSIEYKRGSIINEYI